MNLQEIEERVAQLDLAEGSELIHSLLSAYGFPKAAISRLKTGTYNRSSSPGETLWKNRVMDRYVDGEAVDLHALIDHAASDERVLRERPRFLIVRNDARLLALDTKTRDTLDIGLAEISANAAFFLPWAGIEKQQLENLHYADVKAAERMARLYMEIVKANAVETQQDIDRLNIFFARLLFCFFAEDTDVFPVGSFSGAIASLTQPSGEDTASFLDALFTVLDTPEAERVGVPAHFLRFGYVNGKLFSTPAPAPRFTAKARSIVLDSGTLNWSQINPDIFGSMMQAVVHRADRQAYGMHYTSVENILKVIRPLFLDDLHEAFDAASGGEAELFPDPARLPMSAAQSRARLERLHERIAAIRCFDPACGSGNFLVIAYKELRKLEHRILRRLQEVDPHAPLALFQDSRIQLENFYGIEIDGFAQEIAMLSLWLAKHQMNVEFRELFGAEIPLIPLRDAGNIVCGNAVTLDWETVSAKPDDGEVYVVGNPPYLGSKRQTAEHKADMAAYFGQRSYHKDLDYIALWFLKAADYLADGGAEAGLVSTNSVCQGKHVGLMWPMIYARGVEISFAHTSFRWTNQARGGAGVTCVIVGLSASPARERSLYTDGHARRVSNIGPYLLATPHNVIVGQRRAPLGPLPPMVMGSMPRDGGGLLLTREDRDAVLESAPTAARFMRRYMGSDELLKGRHRYCLWVADEDAVEAAAIPALADRFEIVRRERSKSPAASTREMAATPWRFVQRAHREGTSIIVPKVSSERREIIPLGFLDSSTVIFDKAFAIYDPEPWLFALLQSRMHTAWVGTVGGRLETRYSYSNTLCYNTFPVPPLTDVDRARLTEHTFEVLESREHHSDRTLGTLYLPDEMPPDLKRVHEQLDATVDALYGASLTPTDTERLEILFKRYEEMSAAEAVAE